MANEQIKEGDTVMLKSGGPIMTVDEIGSYATCIWFDGYEQHNGKFSVTSLKKVDPEDNE